MPNEGKARHLARDEKEKELDRKLKEKEKELERRMKEVEDMEKKAEAERLRKEKERTSKKKKDETLDKSDENTAETEEAVTASPRSDRKRKRKDAGRKKARKETLSDSSDEDYEKFTIQARTKIPTLEEGMAYAKYKINVDMWKNAMKDYMSKKGMGMALLQALPDEDNRGGLKDQAWKKLGKEKLASKKGVANLLGFLDKKLPKTDFVRCIDLNDSHAAIKYQDGESVDKYIAEAQEIWDQMGELGWPVPAHMKCAALIRGLNLTGTEVHLIASKLSIEADDLEDQTIDTIKDFVDTNRVLTKASNLGKIKEEENVNIMGGAIGYKARGELEGVENALIVHSTYIVIFAERRDTSKGNAQRTKKE